MQIEFWGWEIETQKRLLGHSTIAWAKNDGVDRLVVGYGARDLLLPNEDFQRRWRRGGLPLADERCALTVRIQHSDASPEVEAHVDDTIWRWPAGGPTA